MSDPDMPVTTAATFAATMVDEWVRSGVEHAVVAPGSRSTPLALAVAAESRVQVHVHHDERSAAFMALGMGLADGRPAVLLTTSGTAAAEAHPAVVEADLARVPMIVCTADRPPELRDVGAPQTIDQTRLFGESVRWYTDPGPPDDTMRHGWRSFASRAFAEAVGPPAGPVHVNLPFRDPLVGRADDPPAGRANGAPWHERVVAPRRIDHRDALRIAARCKGRRGVIVAGAGIRHPEHVLLLAHALRWPIFADPRSGCRIVDRAVVSTFDALVRNPVGAPDVVIRLGAPPASKALGQWLDTVDGEEILIDGDGWWLDPARSAAMVIEADPSVACSELAPLVESSAVDAGWMQQWERHELTANRAIDGVLDAERRPSEPGTARAVVRSMPDDTVMVVSSSMPVRDVEWFAAPREAVRVLANRGANGIDGVLSTAMGVALTGVPTLVLLGDIAFLHDSNALLSASVRTVDLTVVVIDNDGGGIFSFLPPARALDTERFEQLFGTPHGLSISSVASNYGVTVHDVTDGSSIDDLVAKCVGSGGVDVIVVRTDRTDNVRVHESLQSAIAAALCEA